MKITLIETGRGCPFACEFCSISSFFHRHYTARPVEDVVREIRELNAKLIFFIDDNIAVDLERTRRLLAAITPLGIKWCGQVSVTVAQDAGLLALMKKSGCIGVLIGFESLNPRNLKSMNKSINLKTGDYRAAVSRFRDHGLGIYGTFVFGYDADTRSTFEETLAFALEQKLFFAAFNHLVPFPGTPLHERLGREERLLQKAWWLERGYRFGDVAFRPASFTPSGLAELCLEYRNKFYSPGSIARRALDFKANCRSPFWAGLYLAQNIIARGDVAKRQGIVLGEEI